MRRATRLTPVADIPDLAIHLADDVTRLLRLTGSELGHPDPSLPYWAFPWPGGLAIARYLREHPEEVAGRRVLDLGAGSGLCAIVAMQVGAASALAIDTDPFSEAAVSLNSRANRVRVRFSRADPLARDPPDCDVIVAGDVCYQEAMADDLVGWLRAAAASGIRVLLGDPGRAYLPRDLARVAAYRVRASREIDGAELTEAAVYAFPAPGRHKGEGPSA